MFFSYPPLMGDEMWGWGCKSSVCVCVCVWRGWRWKMREDIQHPHTTISQGAGNCWHEVSNRKDNWYISPDFSWSLHFCNRKTYLKRFNTPKMDIQGWSECWGQKKRCGWVWCWGLCGDRSLILTHFIALSGSLPPPPPPPPPLCPSQCSSPSSIFFSYFLFYWSPTKLSVKNRRERVTRK